MEEISSSDSFHSYRSDGDSGPTKQPAAEATSKLDSAKNSSKEAARKTNAKSLLDRAISDTAGTTTTTANADDGSEGGKDDDVDDEFEHISEGTFDLDDENSMVAEETESPAASNKEHDMAEQGAQDDDNDEDDAVEDEAAAATATTAEVDEVAEKESAEDANKSETSKEGSVAAETGKDIQFSELDMSLAVEDQERPPPSAGDGADDDDDDDDVNEQENADEEVKKSHDASGDAAAVQQADDDIDPIQEDAHKSDGADENATNMEAEEEEPDPGKDDSIENKEIGADGEMEVGEADEDEGERGEAEVGDTEEAEEAEETDKTPEKEAAIDEQHESAVGEEDVENKTAESSKSIGQQQPDSENSDDDDPDNENDAVENVQEPLESDVCLIPDDTETEVTEAEKAKAILARQNAEKDDEAPSLTKEPQGEAASPHAVEESPEEEEAEKDATAEAVNAGQSEEAAENADAMEVDGHPEADEPLLEEMQRTDDGSDAAPTKTLIVWIIATMKVCVQCEEEKSCGFRYRNVNATDAEPKYLCDQACCDAFMLDHPHKYFIRRKKFLVEEFSESNKNKDNAAVENASAEEGAATEADTAMDTTNDKTDSGSSNETTAATTPTTTEHECLQCKETAICKYFLKQDDDVFYLCTDACYSLLNAIEPEKFKLKRHSIRVRNIGATLTTPSTSKKTAASAAATPAEAPVVARTTAEAEAARLERVASFTRRCADCLSEITLGDRNLLWETIDFCNEICLGRYQRNIGSNCCTCDGEVSHQALGKYCVRFGFDIRQFCCAACLNDFKKGLKTCSCCQKDMSGGNEGFLAPVGDKEQFKDFCSQACMRRYDSMCNPKKKLRNDVCAVCNHEKAVRVEIHLDGKEHTFCSNPCFSAFKFVSNVIADQCNMCCKYFERKGAESFTIYTGRHAKVFCSTVCLNVYIIVNRRIVSCQWCKVKKYNFDMIYKQQEGQEILMCSLNCLTLYGVSINAFSRTMAKCDHCNNTATPQYHLTMSDASMRNFCTYQCVMQFQSQFARAPLTLENEAAAQPSSVASIQDKSGGGHSSGSVGGVADTPFPTGLPKRVKLRPMNAQGGQTHKNSLSSKKLMSQTPSLPIISTVASLASGETETMVGNITVRRGRCRGRRLDSPPPLAAISSSSVAVSAGTSSSSSSAAATTTQTTTPGRGRPKRSANLSGMDGAEIRLATHNQLMSSKRAVAAALAAATAGTATGGSLPAAETQTLIQSETKIITVPPYPAAVRNVQTSCKPQMITQSAQTKPQTCDAACQTSKDYSNKVLIPVPVPIYVPQPMYMYATPFPVPIPIPLPIPVPIFIPTTRNSSQGILKEIKKIQDKMPTDPFEAELLMMAEMVAEERNESESESDSEIKPEPHVMTTTQTSTMSSPYGGNVVQPLDVANNSYGEDVLQMALKMATGEYDTPSVDLESAMATNTIGSSPTGGGGGMGVGVHDDSSLHQMNSHQMQQHQAHLIETPNRGGRGRKRGSIVAPVTPRNGRSPIKRQRMLQDMDHVETQPLQHQQQQNMMQVVAAATAVPVSTEKPDANMCLKYTFGVNAWKQWVMTKNADIEKSSVRRRTFKTELLQMTADELNHSLCLFVKEVRKPNGTEYAPDTIYYLVLGIQQYLYENGRIDNIFTDPYYERFTECLDEVARKFSVLYNDSQYIVTRVEEEHLWECKQLGAHSPHVLLSTLMFFNTKHFNLTTVEEHMQLSFSHIMKHWKRSAQNAKTPGTRNVLLRFYPPQAGLDANPRKKKVYEQQENEDNPLRCPVRLYEFYLSKCPESVKTRNDVFYLQPERSCVPDSPVWYSTQALSQDALQKMLHRVKMVKEINIALLTS